jgi:protein-tyrosine phosphatase
MAETRHLAWPSAANIRELGGYQTRDGATTAWRAFLRGDNLCRLTPDGCAALAEYGVRTIIDLRSANELAAAPHPFAERRAAEHEGIIYVNTPIIDEDDIAGTGRLGRIGSLQEMYRLILDHYGMRLGNALRAASNAPEGAVLFHCHAGKDRTGLMAMFLLTLADVPEETIAADYALSSQYLVNLHNEILSRLVDDPAEHQRMARLLDTTIAVMEETIAYLDQRHGGALAYLERAGVSAEQRERLRRRLRTEG